METILQAMDQTIEVHRTLIELGREKQSVLIRNEVNRLSQITQKENKLIKLVEDLETFRAKAVNAFLQGKGLAPVGTVSVRDLSRLVVKLEDKEALLSRGQLLLSLVEELRTIHAANKQLIVQSLAYIDFSLDLFSAYPEQEATYTHPLQNQSHGHRNRMFDSRA